MLWAPNGTKPKTKKLKTQVLQLQQILLWTLKQKGGKCITTAKEKLCRRKGYKNVHKFSAPGCYHCRYLSLWQSHKKQCRCQNQDQWLWIMPPAHLSRNFATVHLPWLEPLQIQHEKDQNRDVEQKPDLLCSFKTQTCKMIEALNLSTLKHRSKLSIVACPLQSDDLYLRRSPENVCRMRDID